MPSLFALASPLAAAALSLACFGCGGGPALTPTPDSGGADAGGPSPFDAAPVDAVAGTDVPAPTETDAGGPAAGPCTVKTADGAVLACTTLLVGSQLDDSYCGMKADGQLRCWSYHEYFDELLARIVARAPAGLVRIAISETNGDDPFLCGIDGQGKGTCWGANGMIDLGSGVASVVLSRYGTCAVYGDGHVSCGSSFPKLPSDRRYVQVAVGADFNLGLDDTGRPVHVGTDLQIAPGFFRKITMFSSLGAALRDDGAMVLVDQRLSGVMPGAFVDMTFAYRENLCGLDAAGEITCFNLVAGVTAPPAAPAGPFVQFAGSGQSLCGLRPDGTTTCWGDAQVRVPDGW
jgi:hypothetical protein